jgi:hypothetical protein
MGIIVISGTVTGVALGLTTIVLVRLDGPWFAISLSILVAIMMVTYVALPSRLIGMRAVYSRQDKLKATVLGGALGAAVSSPPYLMARLGIVMLATPVWFIPGIIVLSIGIILHAGATSAVRVVKMSAKLVAGQHIP